jgi:hypothetical protein
MSFIETLPAILNACGVRNVDWLYMENFNSAYGPLVGTLYVPGECASAVRKAVRARLGDYFIDIIGWRPIVIGHAPSCPVADPAYVCSADPYAPQRCTCNIMSRLKDHLKL